MSNDNSGYLRITVSFALRTNGVQTCEAVKTDS